VQDYAPPLDHNYALNAADSFLSNKVTAQLTLSINRNTQQLIPGSIPPQLIGNRCRAAHRLGAADLARGGGDGASRRDWISGSHAAGTNLPGSTMRC